MKKVNSQALGISLIVFAITIMFFGNDFIDNSLLYITLGALIGFGLLFVILKKDCQPFLNRTSYDEWILYVLTFVGLAFIFNWITDTYSIDFLITLILFIPVGLIVGKALRPVLGIR